MNGKNILEEVIENNIRVLRSILFIEENVLLDTNILNGPSLQRTGDIIDDSLRENISFLDESKKESLKIMEKFLGKLEDCVESFYWVMSVPEIIDEMSNFKYMCRDRRNFMIKYSSRNFINNFDENYLFDFFENIKKHSGRIIEILQNRNIDNKFQFMGDNYHNLKNIVNLSYNFFIKEEKICPDDFLVAGALTLLKNGTESVAVISNDRGVYNRIRVIKSIYSAYPDIDPEMYEKIISQGISIYHFDSNVNKYMLRGSTKFRGMKIKLHRSRKTREEIKWAMKYVKDKN
jgi:hypothetical protein